MPVNDADRLIHIEAIRNLKARYFRLLDTEAWGGLGALFVDDVVVEFPGRAPLASRSALLEALRAHHTDAEVVTVHQGHTSEIEVRDDGTATGIWAMSDLVDRIWHADGRRECFRGFGHYYDTYVLTDAGWAMSSMRLTRLRFDWVAVDAGTPFPHRGGPAVDVHRPARPD